VHKKLHCGGCAKCFENGNKNFSLHAHPLIKLTRKDKPFVFSPEQIQVQEDFKTALLESPALRAIDYTSSTPVILAIHTSYIAVAFNYANAMSPCCGEWCPSAFNSFELPSWMLYQDVQLPWDSGLVRGESGYSL
jgi:hypothetical protein